MALAQQQKKLKFSIPSTRGSVHYLIQIFGLGWVRDCVAISFALHAMIMIKINVLNG